MKEWINISIKLRPNPALKGTPRVRGFATAPGSPLACFR
jgi:hypothetical protein